MKPYTPAPDAAEGESTHASKCYLSSTDSDGKKGTAL